MMICAIGMGILLCVVSCNKNAQEKKKGDFDSVLLKKNTELQLSGEYEKLIELNIEYLKKAAKMQYQEGKALCYLNIAEVNISTENYEKALFLLEKAGEQLKDSESSYHKAVLYDDYSQYYSYLNLIDKGIMYNDKAFYYINRAKRSALTKKLIPRLYLTRGIYFARKGWFGTSLKCIMKGNELENSVYSNCMVAQYYLIRHQLDSARVYIAKTNDMIQRQKASDVESFWVYSAMGYYYNAVNNNDEAEKAFKKALEINIKTRRTYSSKVYIVYKALAELYRKKNDGGKAYYYLKKYMEEEKRMAIVRMAAMNKSTENFISGIKPESDWHRSDLPLAIALSIAALTISGIYVQKTIKAQQQKKRALKKETEELKNHVKAKMLKEVTELAQKNDSSFLMKFKGLYPDFITTLLKINPDLENSELAFCAMLKLHFSSKEIADYTFVQHRSVQQKKYRIRKRLNIPGEEDIYDFFDKIAIDE